MKRVIIALAVIGSFNVIAIQLFMSGNAGPLQDLLPFQQAVLITAFYIVILDIILVYMIATFHTKRNKPSEEFNKIFAKYFNGKNFDEAFDRASREWKKRM